MPQLDQGTLFPDSLGYLADSNRGVAEAREGCSSRQTPEATGQCLRCEVREGIPLVRGHVWSYYSRGQDGSLMLVLSLKSGERIRVNSSIKVVILKAHDGQLKLGFQVVEALRDRR